MFSKLVRLTRDAELQTTNTGKQVCRISAAYDVGWGENKKTVWVEGSLWGDRGQKLAQYLTKGSQLVIHGDDVEPNAYQKKDGSGIGSSLRMTINNVELVARNQQSGQDFAPQGQGYQQSAPSNNYQAPQQRAPQQNQGYANQSAPAPQNNGGFSDAGFIDDDIPF